MPGPEFIPKDFDQLAEWIIQAHQRFDNLDTKLGTGLSHNDLLDIEDHEEFFKTDGSRAMTGSLDLGNNMVRGARNPILRADVQRGEVQINRETNQLTASGTDSKAVSAGTAASTSDSKALSAASTSDSKVLSQSTLISTNTSRIDSAH